MKQILIVALGVGLANQVSAFCGFYVSKADGTLKNKTSQVILARDGNKTKVTMYNDFKGNAKDFALVVPVPVLLKQEDIKVVDQGIFQRLNEYSSPRLVEYYDQNPCYDAREKDEAVMYAPAAADSRVAESVTLKKGYGVKIEARYLVGEYEILILGAKESNGLKRWLTDHGYKIPDAAEEVLDPYIRSNMKFFVAKVNPAQQEKMNGQFLRPIQISFSSPKFILPIRLGMANADGDQDLIVYGLTRQGKIECTNYRNVNIPTDKNIPLFIQQNFNAFYGNLFSRQWAREGKNIAFLEYAWDVTPVNQMKCDPCVGNPPVAQELVQAGAWWLQQNNWNDYSNLDDDPSDGNDRTFFTRLHFRYNRSSFPQDLAFQLTPDNRNFQARYIITHPATGNLNCDAGRQYLQKLKARRKTELRELMELTGTNLHNWQQDLLSMQDEDPTVDVSYAQLLPSVQQNMDHPENGLATMALVSVVLIGSAGWMKWKGLI